MLKGRRICFDACFASLYSSWFVGIATPSIVTDGFFIYISWILSCWSLGNPLLLADWMSSSPIFSEPMSREFITIAKFWV